MPKFLLFLLCLALLVGCNSTTPPPFQGLEQRQIAGPGTFSYPRWSPDGRYLAFMDRDGALHVYDTTTERHSIATHGVSAFFNWVSPSQLSYLKQRPNATNLTYPILHDLNVVNPNGDSNTVVVEGLKNAKDFFWLKDGHSIVILLNEDNKDIRARDVYLAGTRIGSKERLISLSELQVSNITSLALSSDEKQLLIYAIQGDSFPSTFLIIYDLEQRKIQRRIALNPLFEDMDLDQYHKADFGSEILNFVTVGTSQWVIGRFIAFKGKCYNYSIYFLNLDDNAQSFCIPSKAGPIADVAISPDLNRIAFINARGPGLDYLFIADLPQEYKERLAR